MAASAAERRRKRRAALRKQGLRPVTIWVHDTRDPAFVAEARRQSRLLRDDPQEEEILDWIEKAYDGVLDDVK